VTTSPDLNPQEARRLLQDAGEAYQLAPPPFDRILLRYRRRHRLRSAAVIASVAVVVASLSITLSETLPGGTAARRVVVPASTPAGSALTPSTQRTTAPTSIVGCSLADLKLTLGPSGAAAGTFYQQIDFQNQSKKTCTLNSYPVVSLIDDAGKPVGHAANPINVTGQPPAPVNPAPGQYANAAVGFPDPSNVPSSTCNKKTTAAISVALPNVGTISISIPFRTDICTSPQGQPFVTPIRPGRSATAIG
jgi:hypothetical protein